MNVVKKTLYVESGSAELLFPETTDPHTREHISQLLNELALKQVMEGGESSGKEETGDMPVPGIYTEAG